MSDSRETPGSHQKEVNSMSQRTFGNIVRVGLWALPVYGVTNLVSTLASQPNYRKHFLAYANYIHTPSFLASHLVLSILGAGIGLIGFTALFVYLSTGRDPVVPVTGYVATIFGSMAAVSVIGVAAFAQPAIGKALLAGHHDVVSLNSSVYSTPLNLTASIGIALLFVGTVLFARAMAKSGSLPKKAGILLAVSIPIFVIGSLMGNALDTVGALGQIASTIWIARSSGRALSSELLVPLNA
jgi:hypothetical protein